MRTAYPGRISRDGGETDVAPDAPSNTLLLLAQARRAAFLVEPGFEAGDIVDLDIDAVCPHAQAAEPLQGSRERFRHHSKMRRQLSLGARQGNPCRSPVVAGMVG